MPSTTSKLWFTTREICDAAALGALATTALLVWQFAPFSTFFMLLCAFPFTLVGLRERYATGILCVASAIVVGFLVGGRVLSQECCAIGVLGITVGYCEKQRLHVVHKQAIAMLLGLLAAGVVIGALLLFPHFRELNFSLIRSMAHTAAHTVKPGDDSRIIDDMVNRILEYWMLVIAIIITIFVTIAFNIVRKLFALPMHTAAIELGINSLENIIDSYEIHSHPSEPAAHHNHTVLPITVNIDSYSRAGQTILSDLQYSITSPGLYGVVGPNGAGKSTYARLLAGLEQPTTGAIRYHGTRDSRLGKIGGTAVIFQRPQSQVIGMRVIDDLYFGLETQHDNASELLTHVGLSGLEYVATEDLSGGQLQRLAIASALMRSPHLLISDESTAMIDPAGRQELLKLFHHLTSTLALVHITHRREELTEADNILEMHSTMKHSTTKAQVSPRKARGVLLECNQLSKTYLPHTPWQHQAIKDTTIRIPPGQLVAITGCNGSGKTTLARLIAGLDQPSHGSVTRHTTTDNPEAAPKVLFAAQHSAAQLIAATVSEELGAYAALSPREKSRALGAVGFTEEEIPQLLKQHPYSLSGGQSRRVQLASLFAACPDVLILDEPLAGCDSESSRSINNAIASCANRNCTVIAITHDIDEQDPIFHRTITLDKGRIIHDTKPEPNTNDHHIESLRPPRWRLRLKDVYGRSLPGPSFAHNLWIGTKIYALLLLTLGLLVSTNWIMVATCLVFVTAWAVLVKLPLACIPRPRWTIMLLIVLGQLGVALGGGGHTVTIAGVTISLTGLNSASLYILLSATMIFSYVLFTYSTPIALIAPFAERFMGLALLRPVCISIVLALRLLPSIVNEGKAMRELAPQRAQERQALSWFARTTRTELAISIRACQVTLQRATEMAQAILARGGAESIGGKDHNPGFWDWFVIILLTSVIGFMMIVIN